MSTKPAGHHFTYIVRCRDRSLYTGWTTDLEKRIRTHNSGKGAKYTRSRKPVELVYHESYTIHKKLTQNGLKT